MERVLSRQEATIKKTPPDWKAVALACLLRKESGETLVLPASRQPICSVKGAGTGGHTHTQSCSLKTNRYGKKLYAIKSHESLGRRVWGAWLRPVTPLWNLC